MRTVERDQNNQLVNVNVPRRGHGAGRPAAAAAAAADIPRRRRRGGAGGGGWWRDGAWRGQGERRWTAAAAASGHLCDARAVASCACAT